MNTTIPTENELAELGFKTASESVKQKQQLARKLRIAFEHFRIVEPDKINAFNQNLLERSKVVKDRHGSYSYKQLVFTRIENYTEVPPREVLEKVREAKALECFDHFEIATIQDQYHSKVPDPIVFGIIDGSQNKYFVAQWDNDVRIEDILKPDEG